MKFNLANRTEVEQAKDYLKKLELKYAVVEITQKHNRRSLSQNSYLHLLLSYCALEIGEDVDYFKQHVWKEIINKDIFLTEYINPKTGETRPDWRSSADLSTQEMTLAVDRLLDFSSKELGFELPLPNDSDALRKIQNNLDANKRYL